MIAEYINSHQAEFWIVVGFLLLSIEVSLGFVAGIFLFASLGAIITGLLMTATILPETWQAGIASSAVSAGVVTLLLWKYFKKFQGDDEPSEDNSSDLIGYEFVLQQTITTITPGKTSYSGINWTVEIDSKADLTEIKQGQRVTVSSVDVGIFRVKPH